MFAPLRSLPSLLARLGQHWQADHRRLQRQSRTKFTLEQLEGRLVPATSVSIAAINDGAESATPTPGLFRVTLSAAATADTTVNYTVSGTATNGTDYTRLTGSVVVSQGATTADIPVAVLDDQISEGTETVILTLAASTGLTLGSPNTATVNITDDDSHDLAVTETVSATTVTAGAVTNGAPSNLNYTITVRNPGTTDATGIVVTQTLPLGSSINVDTTTLPNGVTATATGVTWTVASLTAGSSRNITVRILVGASAASGDLVAPVSVTANGTVINTSDDTASVTTTISRQIDLTVRASGDKKPVHVGETLTYTITAVNAGPSNANNVIITETVPAGTKADPTDVTVAGWKFANGHYTMGVGTVRAGLTVTVPFFKVIVLGPATATTPPIRNVISVADDATAKELTPANNTVNVDTAVNLPPTVIPLSYFTPRGQVLAVPYTQGLLARAQDIDHDKVTIAFDVRTSAGSIYIRPNGSFRYTPPAGFVGIVTVRYRVFDGTNYSGYVFATIRVGVLGRRVP